VSPAWPGETVRVSIEGHRMDATLRRRHDKSSSVRAHVAWCLLPQVIVVLFAAGLGGRGAWLGLPVVVLLTVLPSLDLLTRWQDDRRFEPRDFGRLATVVLRSNVRLYAICDVLLVIFATTLVRRLGTLEVGLLLASAGLMSATGFAAAHELLHSPARVDRLLQRVFTTFLFYPHYKLIHVYSHHVHASTALDENTAWRGENIYGYLARTVPGSVRRSWTLDRERRLRETGRTRGHWRQNRMLEYAAGQCALLAGLLGLSGLAGLLFYVAHLVVAHVVLESVNYIQHYGLMRGRRAEGADYERTGPGHAWDSYHFFSSYITFRVGHHSNHHLNAGPYYLLLPEADAPKLPLGYFWAIGLVLVPPGWRKVIEPRLERSACRGKEAA
jgi:alkane 1-monooxygenase